MLGIAFDVQPGSRELRNTQNLKKIVLADVKTVKCFFNSTFKCYISLLFRDEQFTFAHPGSMLSMSVSRFLSQRNQQSTVMKSILSKEDI